MFGIVRTSDLIITCVPCRFKKAWFSLPWDQLRILLSRSVLAEWKLQGTVIRTARPDLIVIHHWLRSLKSNLITFYFVDNWTAYTMFFCTGESTNLFFCTKVTKHSNLLKVYELSLNSCTVPDGVQYYRQYIRHCEINEWHTWQWYRVCL